jgi:hypothetical protein
MFYRRTEVKMKMENGRWKMGGDIQRDVRAGGSTSRPCPCFLALKKNLWNTN